MSLNLYTLIGPLKYTIIVCKLSKRSVVKVKFVSRISKMGKMDLVIRVPRRDRERMTVLMDKTIRVICDDEI